MTDQDKFKQSIKELKDSLGFKKKALKEHIYYAGIAKCFEVCLEYSWKHLKRELENQGLEAFSPKEIVKVAGQSGIIDDVETWLKCINVRNIAVHDYLGVSPAEYLEVIEKFMKLVQKFGK